ncbi:hypothetical protein OMK64_02475 [Cellulomonas fimi]|uniref:hypothetical protein n=1 Tax=Cellulomonas fimi TaxID=1708 RepID=UPI00234E0C4A|nr:hypothetical protein [Cellulomonas fimi]MDC7120396.1 hypothetical protein [Cellulomonas fimi]
MAGRRGRGRALAGAAVGAVLIAAVASPSAAAAEPPPTLCSDIPGSSLVEQSVEGDLVVDVDCWIFRGTVHGDVTVRAGTTFSVGRATLDGDAEVAGRLELGDSRVHGDVTLTSTDTASLTIWVGDGAGGSVDGDVTGQAADVVLEAARVWGSYDVEVRDATRVRGRSELMGPAAVTGGRLLVHGATFYGGLTSAGSGDVLVCGATVAGDLRVTGLTDFASIGAEPRRDQRDCPVLVTGSLVLVDNPHSVDLGNVAVARDLVCTGSSGPRGVTETSWTEVHGDRTGQCVR